MPRIYLDNSATSFPKAPGIDKVIGDYLTKTGCNLNRGGYSATCLSAKVAKEARAWLAELFNFPTPSNVVINSGVTYSLNTVLQGILKPGDHVLTSSLEHNAVTRPLHLLRERIGIEFECIPCDAAGRMRVDAVEGMLRPNTRMVVCTHASNVSGVITPLSELGAICRKHGVLFVVDSAQTAGILHIDTKAMGIDILCFAGHKGLFGPPGTGGFCVPDELVDGYGSERAKLQRADAATWEAIDLIKSTPSVKAIIAGHLHRDYENMLTEGIIQLTTDCETVRVIELV
jgi:selenocysteine lyase/cysteine desulfurase